jgi:hypothetical protein
LANFLGANFVTSFLSTLTVPEETFKSKAPHSLFLTNSKEAFCASTV